MIRAFLNLLTSRNGKLASMILSSISILLALRGIVNSKKSFWSIINLISAGISGYLLLSNLRETVKSK